MSLKKSVNIVTMGCSKNLVDSERLMNLFTEAGFTTLHNASNFKGDIVVVNTCGFIGDAKEESIEMILQCAQAKQRGDIKKLYVMGCLSERYKKELPNLLPEVDEFYGKFDWVNIVADLLRSNPATVSYDRVLTTPKHHAYIKIAEGCNRFCAFCAIPLITGRFKSRSIEEIKSEVTQLVARGVKEFNIIAQELTSYGIDIYGHRAIGELIDAIASVPGVEWIRLHYAYPTDFPDELLYAMSRNKNVCKYLDIALQHVSDKVLSNMRRHITGEETRKLLKKIRETVPGIHIRTTLMVGFPGEGEAEFDELMKFVEEQRFERMGAFAYCEEDDTYAAKNFTDDIPNEVKQQRLDRLMLLQERIAEELNQQKVGQEMRVIIDDKTPEGYVGRTEYDSPEVDPEVLIYTDKNLKIGDFYKVKIEKALPFELIGNVVE